MKRREFLATGVFVGTIATAGCLSWFGSNESNSDADENTDGESDADSASDQSEDDDGDPDSDQGTGDEGEQEDDIDKNGTEDDEQDDTDDELYPDEEDTEIDRDQYDEPEQRETTERDDDDVEIEATYDVDDMGNLTISGTVTNVSDEPIDAVDLNLSVYDPEDEYLWGEIVGVEDLDSGAREAFEGGWAADEERGEVDHVEIVPTVYDYADDETED